MAQRSTLEVNFTTSPLTVGAVEGLRVALAEMSGHAPADLATWKGLRVACRKIAEAHARPDGMPALALRHGDEAGKDGVVKRVVAGVRLAEPRDAIMVAHHFANDVGRMRVKVENAFKSDLAKVVFST